MQGRREEKRSPIRGPSVARVADALWSQSQEAGEGSAERSCTVCRTFVLWQPESEGLKAVAVVPGQRGATVWVDGWQVTAVSSRSGIGRDLQQTSLGGVSRLGQVVSVDGSPVLPPDERRQREARPAQAMPGSKERAPISGEGCRHDPADAGTRESKPDSTAPPRAQPRARESAAPPARERIARREELERFCSDAYPALRGRCQALLASLPELLDPHPAPQPLRVAFIGRFMTGKSRLLNAMLGENLLPCDVGECTAGLTTLCYGSKLRCFLESGDRSEEVSLERLRQQANAQHQDGVPTANLAFRIEAPRPILEGLTLMDTPGYGGTQDGSGERARMAIDRAASQADLCVMVLRAIGIDRGDVEAACRVLPICPEMVVLLNHSDDYDADQMTESLAASMAQVRQHAAPSTPGFVVSALWQAASHAKREAIRSHRREEQGYEEEPVHEWEAFTSHLSAVASRRRERWAWQRLAAGEKACALALEIERDHDPRAQAEHNFLSHLPTLERLLVPPLGPAILQQAVKAAREGRPLPWAVLAKFGITPQLLAPRMALSEGLAPQIREHCLALALGMGREAYQRYDHAAVAQLRLAIGRISSSVPQAGSLGECQRERFEWWEWCTGCLDAKFEYCRFFDDLRSRWMREPELIATDAKAVCQQLRDSIGPLGQAPPRHPLSSSPGARWPSQDAPAVTVRFS